MRQVYSTHKWLNLEPETVSIYNSWDCLSTVRIYKALKLELQQQGQWDFYRQRVWGLVEPVRAMMKRGLPCSMAERTKLKSNLTREINATEKPILQALNTGLTGSVDKLTPNLMRKLLFDDLDLKPSIWTDTGLPSVKQEALIKVLQRLRKKDAHAIPLLHACFHRSRLSTIRSRYLEFAITDGRVYPTIKIHGADTGRFAYADPPIQQWPPEIRHIIVCDEGNTFVGADYSQLEARILAVLSNDQPSLDAFAKDEDIHISNTLDLFGWKRQEFLELSTDQQKGSRGWSKGFLYGISYGGEADSLSAKVFCPCPLCEGKVPPTYSLTKNEIKAAQQRWMFKHHRVAEWREELVRETTRTKTYTNPFGDKHTFFGPMSEAVTKLYNNPMQGSAARIMNDVLLRNPTWPWVLQMHDELMLEVPEAEAPMWCDRLKKEMELPVKELDGTVFPVDVRKGNSWGSMTSLES